MLKKSVFVFGTNHVYRLPCHPTHGQRHAAVDPVVISSVEVVVCTEVRDLDLVPLTHQTVPENIVNAD